MRGRLMDHVRLGYQNESRPAPYVTSDTILIKESKLYSKLYKLATYRIKGIE